MYHKTVSAALLSFIFLLPLSAFAAEKIDHLKPNQDVNVIERPLIERYILDELRQLRQDQQAMRGDLVEKVADAKLESSDRALKYTADTTNNIFYIITAAASLIVLVGWKSLRDIRQSIGAMTNKKIAKLTADYEERLHDIEKKMKLRSEQIISTQEEISLTNNIHSLWMRAGIEKNVQERLAIYDQILELKPFDLDALTYKADTLLDIGEKKWALSLTNQVIEKDPEYAMAYWQRACAHAALGNETDAINDILRAVEITPSLKKDLAGESFFKALDVEEILENIQTHSV